MTSSCLWVLCAVLGAALLVGPSMAVSQREKCRRLCYQRSLSSSKRYLSQTVWKRRYQNCMEDCLDDEDEPDEDEPDEDENEGWKPRTTKSTEHPHFKTRPPFTGSTYNPYVTTPVYPGWTYRPPYTQRPPIPVVTVRPPPFTYRPPRPFVTFRPPWTTRRNRITTTATTTVQRRCGVRRMLRVRVIGGAPTDSCEFPWMVGINVYAFFCGGTILDPRHVMTAAHCLKNVLPGSSDVAPPSEVTVLYGSSKRSQMKTVGVARVQVNPKYDYFRMEYDVAILTLEKDLVFGDCTGPICLPEVGQSPEGMDECVTAGWGIMDPTLQSWVKPNTLQKVTLPLVSRDLCQRAWAASNRVTIDEFKLCAGVYGVGGKDACKGDSGGPLMCRSGRGPFIQFGIVSFGHRCADGDWPGVYTNVAHPRIMDFIRSSINDL